MLNSLRDGQINYGTTNFPSAHVPPHNVVAPIHQNSLISTEPTTPVVYPWNSTPRLEHLYGFHSRYYNLDFPTPYPPSTNQYAPPNMYGQNVSQCCQPCCRLRSQNIPKTSPPQVLYNPIRPVQQLNRSYKSKKTVKTPCSEQFLPYIPNDLPVKYDTQNCYQPKYSSSYLNNTNYCPPANNLWVPPTATPTWSTDRLRPIGHHTGVVSHDFSRNNNYQRLQNYQSNPYTNPTSVSHRPYNYIPPVVPDVHDYRPPVYHNQLKNSTSEYIPHEHNSKLSISSQSNQSLSSLQQYYNTQPVPYPDIQRPNEPLKSQNTPENSSKSNLNVREFLSTWDEGEEEIGEKSFETTAPIVVLDCMTLEGDALTKVQEKLNVVSYENLEKVLKENQNPIVINTESNEIDSIYNKAKPPSKPNFEPLDYTKRETGIIKPFNTEKKILPEPNSQSEKSYSVNFDGMVAWYGKKNTDISSTDLIEKLADRIFNLSKSQENDGVSFGTASYTGQITQTNRSIEDTIKNSSKYIQSQQMFDLHHTDKCVESSVINKTACNNDTFPRIHSRVLNESNKTSTVKSNNENSSCIVENITKKCLNISNTNEETTPWNLNQSSPQEQHLNMSLYDHNVVIKPLDFSSLTDETKSNPFVFEKNTSSGIKPNDSILSDQFNKALNGNNNYNCTVSNNQHTIQQIDSSNRNFPVIVSPHINRQEYNGFHESVIQRTGCDKNKLDKVQTQTDFESMNWNISNDLDKIMKNTNIAMEPPPCLYDRNNYNVLDSINSNKIVSNHNQWKDNVPCMDLTVNSKMNLNHDSFFDNWNFIESYENHSNKKIVNPSSNNNNELHNPLFPNQLSLEESNNNNNNNNTSSEKVKNETLVKDIPFSKSNNMSSNNTHSRDVFNLNSQIPDFSDGFELTGINESHDYMQFKKLSNDNEHRTDGSIFEHFTEPKCTKTVSETINAKNDHIKPDIIGLPSFKDKEPLAPMPVPPKLNIVKPIIRDPSQIYTVIKQKLKYDTPCVENDNLVSNKTGHNLRGNQSNIFNGMALKSKYNNVQLNQFDVWSEKFVLKNNSNNLSSPVVQCDVEIKQFKSTPENRITLIPKSNISENFDDKNTKLTENTNCNLIADKINIIENNKIDSNVFLNCLESTKTDDQKYRDTLDEFETSFGFDIHCNNESNKSFHEDIVDKCFEETINDKIDEHNINTSNSTNTSNGSTITSNNTQLPFQCHFESGYLIKNYFDENKNKAVVLEQKQTNNHEKSNTTAFNCHTDIKHDFELQNNKNIHTTSNSEENSNFIRNDVNRDIEHIQNDTDDNNSSFRSTKELKHSLEPNHEITNINKTSSTGKNNFDYLSIEGRHFEYENNNKNILKSTESKEIIGIDNLSKDKINYNSDSNIHKLPNIQKKSNVSVDFEDINNTNIFDTNSNSSSDSTTEINKKHELKNNNNSLESTFHSKNIENIEHRINSTNIFELNNDNSDMYQTQKLEKNNAFDFETRIIKNFEFECSNSNDEGSTTKQIDNQINAKYNYETNDKEKSVQTELNCKNTLGSIHSDLQIAESSDLDCNDDTKLLTSNINKKNDINHVFEIGIINNIQEKLNSETRIGFDFQNENTEEVNLNKCSTHENLNAHKSDEVEKIFEKLHDNLKILNTEKEKYNLSEYQNDENCDFPKNVENIGDQNTKIEIEKKIDVCHNESNETFEETDNVLLREFVNNSCSTTDFLQQNELLNEENHKELTLKEYNTSESDKHVPNRNENFLNMSNKTEICENIATFKEQNECIKQSKTELVSTKNMQVMKNTMVNILESDTTKKKNENIKFDLLNVVKNPDIISDDEHGLNTGSILLNQVELMNQQNVNEIVKVGGLTSSESSSLTNNSKLSSQKHGNNIFEVEDLINSESCSLNNVEFTYQAHSNDIVGVEVSSSSESSSSIKSVQFTCQKNYISEDSTDSEYSSINHVEFTCRKNSNEFVEDEDLKSSESSSLNNVKCITQKSASEISEDEDSSISSLNNVEHTCQKHSNDIVEVVNSTNFECSFLNRTELTSQNRAYEIVEAGDLMTSISSSLNNIRITSQEDSNKFVEVVDSINSESRSSNIVKFTNYEHINDIVETEDSISSEPISSNQVELSHQHDSNSFIEIEDSTNVGPNLLNSVELKSKKNVNELSETEDSISSKPRSLNHSECIRQHDSNYIVEVENSTQSIPSSLNDLELTSQQHCNNIVEDPTSVKSSVLSINNSVQSNNSCFENTDSKNVLDDKKLPRVKFILKCHSKSLMKKNIFEEESTVCYKKSCLAIKNETCSTRHIFKKRNSFYKPWHNIYRKQRVDEPKENIKTVDEATCQPTSPDDVLKNANIVSVDDEKVNEVVSLAELNVPNDGEWCNDTFNNVENEKNDTDAFAVCTVDDDDDLYIPFTHERRTPMPSPSEDFESETETSDYYGDEEYWDKSLENEYKNVLYKTISKLAKSRVHVRDKFNTRLLARRANGGAKQRKRRRRRRQRQLLDEMTAEERVDDNDHCALSKPVAVIATKTMTPRCKIKVQLPWGRIFNLNNQDDHRQRTIRDMKIELGPAKVEVRLSRTPGEWQVAACRSTASSMSVVNVRRLVLQRAKSPAKDCNHDSSTISNHSTNSADSGSGNGSGSDSGNRSGSGVGSNGMLQDERTRKLPKIVIRRIGQDNNYTSYVRSGGGIEGGDNVDGGSPRLIVRLVRDQQLDAMAADGVTTINLKHHVPIDESAADTHDAKRIRYT